VNKKAVLIVEDEFLVRLAAAAIIEDAGFEAIEVANADEAVALLESRDDIRVVFTDITLPGSMDGLKLAAAVRDRWPSIEFILTSGQHSIAADAMPERARCLMKPYSSFQLTQALNALMA
jgi:two-component system, response regulator PdtaR